MDRRRDRLNQIKLFIQHDAKISAELPWAAHTLLGPVVNVFGSKVDPDLVRQDIESSIRTGNPNAFAVLPIKEREKTARTTDRDTFHAVSMGFDRTPGMQIAHGEPEEVIGEFAFTKRWVGEMMSVGGGK